MNIDDMDDDQLEESIQPTIRHIRDLIGMPATLKVIAAFGGTHLRVPVKYSPDHILVRMLGHDKAVVLVHEFGGDIIYIMKEDAIIRTQRNRRIQNLHRAGVSPTQLSHDFCLSYRQIWTIIGSDHRPEYNPQDELF